MGDPALFAPPEYPSQTDDPSSVSSNTNSPAHSSSQSHFSPLVIGLICALTGAFLVISYYTVIAKYCSKWEAFGSRLRRRRTETQNPGEREENDVIDSPSAIIWPVFNRGLDRSVIESIPILKFEKGNANLGFLERKPSGCDCAVCLSDFQEGESLRLLPRCTHAFHLECIDMWLSSNSNCPLCRADIVQSPGSVIDQEIPNSEEVDNSNNRPEPDSAHAVILGSSENSPLPYRRSFSFDSAESRYVADQVRGLGAFPGSVKVKRFLETEGSSSSSPQSCVENSQKPPGRSFSGPLEWIRRSHSFGSRSLFRSKGSSSVLPL